jgi:hypothetical protein
MRSPRWGMIALSVALLAGALTSACRATYVVVPAPGAGYTAADTLWGHLDGENVRVTFRFDTVTRIRVDTVLRVDTVRAPITTDPTLRRPPRDGAEIRVDTVFRVDTVRVAAPRAPGGRTPEVRVDTIVRVDTVRVAGPGVRVDTLRVVETVLQVDTLLVTDTVVRADTVRVPGQRVLFVPPGQHPPQGQCRVWIHNRPPGQQARAAPCDALGEIPPGAFILFGGEAWDFDYDWIREATARPGAVPAQVVALQRPGRR